MKELAQAGSSLESDAAKDNLKEIISDLTIETIERIGETLPGIGAIFKLGKTYQSIRDMEMMNKAFAFLSEFSEMPQQNRKKLIDKINEDPVYGQKFGSFILTAIDRHDFKEKSVYLARTCKFYERGDMSKRNFIRMKVLIESTDLIDLELWHNKCKESNSRHVTCTPRLAKEKFVSSGVIDVKYNFDKVKSAGGNRDLRTVTSQVINYKLSFIGELLLSILLDDPIPSYIEAYLHDDRY